MSDPPPSGALVSGGKRRRRSLARQSGAGVAALLSLAIFASHALYFYAQFADVWLDCPQFDVNDTHLCKGEAVAGGLGNVVLHGQLGWEAVGAAAASIGLLEHEACATTCGIPSTLGPAPSGFCSALQCDECVAVGPLVSHERCTWEALQPMMQFSYIYSLSTLWNQDAAASCYSGAEPSCTGFHPGRLGAVALIVSSFAWPHVKLLLLHLVIYVPLHKRMRQRICYWLALLGKWTILDVLLMSASTALNKIELDMGLLTVWSRLPRALPQALPLCDGVCASLIHQGELPRGLNCTSLCEGVYTLLEDALSSPHELPHSSIYLDLPVVLQRCMYAFCAAVLISVTCSVFVERLDERRHDQVDKKEAALLDVPSITDTASMGSAGTTPPLPPPPATLQGGNSRTCARRFALGHRLLPPLQLLLTIWMLSLPILKRKVGGNANEVLLGFEVDLDDTFNVYEVAELVGKAGGLDLCLAATFWVFVIISPLLRPTLQTCLALAPTKPRMPVLSHVNRWSRYISHYCALEVFVVVVPLLQITFRFMATDIISPMTFPLCTALADLYKQDECLTFTVELQGGYYVAVAAVVVHLFSGMEGSPVDNQIRSRLQDHARRGGSSLSDSERVQ